jgi:hypothetical protein
MPAREHQVQIALVQSGKATTNKQTKTHAPQHITFASARIDPQILDGNMMCWRWGQAVEMAVQDGEAKQGKVLGAKPLRVRHLGR